MNANADQEAFKGLSQGHTTTVTALPTSGHHSIGSVAQEAYRTLWVAEPDRNERWQRVRGLSLLIGLRTPLFGISKGALGAALIKMRALGLSEEVVDQHLDNFACLMLWADQQGFVRWGRSSPAISVDDLTALFER